MKLATSFISYEQAQHNLELEISADDTFETVFARAQAAWDEICGKVELDGATFTEKTKFYTNLYRVYCYPILYSENAGTNESPEWIYRSPYSGEVTEGKMYTNNGFWDTYRTVYAVYSLLTPSLAGEILDGLLQHYKDSGMIPRWMAPGGTNCMVGTSIEIIFADAYIKGIEFDYETAYEAMLKIASAPVEDLTGGGRPENDTAPFIGYVSNETGNGFSWTVEDFIGDYCIGMMAKALGKTDDAEYYINRALGYVDLYNESAGFFMGKSKTGEWTYGEDFDPINWLGDYTETNAWTMLFTAGVYDGAGLAELLGGKDALAARLDEYFDNSVDTMESLFIASGIHETVEAREVKLGHYQHSNQPSHAVTYLYTYADQPYKTQALTRDVLSRLYVGGEIGQGYLGDEDNGEMAGWYVLSSLGIYPQNMSSGQYIITSPVYDKATLHLDGGDFVIETNGNSMTNVYIQSAELNGEAYSDCFISHSDIADGGTLVLEMGSEPSDWGVDSEPMSVTSGDGAVRPAEDLNDIYPVEDGGSVLTDNTSATAENLADGAAVVIITEGAELDMITVTSGDAEKAPTSFILEASNDGQVWRTLREEKLDFMWDQYVRPYSVPEYLRGVYAQYRITFVGEGQIAEIEFLGRDAEGQELTYIDPAAPDPEPPATEPPVTEPTATDPADTDPSDGGFHAGAAAAIAAAVVIAVMAVILAIKKKK